MSAAVELQQLSKDFSVGWLGRRRRAIDSVTLTLPTGSVCGLMGPNGSGKSTTIKLLLGLLAPTSGVCRVLGCSPDDVPVRRRIGYLPEAAVWPEQTTGREWIALAARLAGLAEAAVPPAVAEAIAAVELGPVADWRIGICSKGQRQRIGLAQAIVAAPELLILDEPADGLDATSASLCAAIIERQRSRGGTVLIASHQFDLLESVCDHVAILEQGRLVAAGPMAELMGPRELTEDLAVEVIPPVAAELERWLAARGGRLRRMTTVGRRLGALYRATLGGEPEGDPA